MARDNMIIGRHFYKALKALNDAEFRECAEVIFDYAFYDITPDDDSILPIASALFYLLKDELDSNKKKIDQSLRNSKEYSEWRKAVFERDHYTCKRCGINRGRVLNAHHIKSFARYPELRFSVDNGITLCEQCHRKVHEENGR